MTQLLFTRSNPTVYSKIKRNNMNSVGEEILSLVVRHGERNQ